MKFIFDNEEEKDLLLDVLIDSDRCPGDFDLDESRSCSGGENQSECAECWKKCISEMNGESVEEQPFGIIPRWIWDKKRKNELEKAIGRYIVEANMSIPLEWIDEYKELLERYTDENYI